MRIILSAIGFLLTTAVLFGILILGWGWSSLNETGPLTEAKRVVIERGAGVSTIANTLQQEGVIREALLMKAAARISGKHTALKAGEYEFAPGITTLAVIDQLAEGDVVQRQITVREGLTSWQVVQIVNGVEGLSGEITEIPAEGSLLPETFSYMLGDERAAIIAHMQESMRKTLDELWAAYPTRPASIQSVEDLVILASIVEKETGVPSERKRVAGVFLNRLEKGIPLQTDPTVIYAITQGKMKDEGMGPLGRRLLRKDLEFNSPYNTYKHAGLTPGPIANPGRDSLEAVLNPEVHSYIYFVADGTGGHAFAETLADHNRNVARWRQVRKESGQ